MSEKKIELLAPAGDMERLEMAVAGLNRGTGEKSRARADETRDVITALLAMREEWRHAQCR